MKALEKKRFAATDPPAGSCIVPRTALLLSMLAALIPSTLRAQQDFRGLLEMLVGGDALQTTVAEVVGEEASERAARALGLDQAIRLAFLEIDPTLSLDPGDATAKIILGKHFNERFLFAYSTDLDDEEKASLDMRWHPFDRLGLRIVRDETTIDEIFEGGAVLTLSREISIELSRRLSLAVFLGATTDVSVSQEAVFSDFDASLEIELEINSPAGPITIHYAHAFDSALGDELSQMRLSFGLMQF